MVKYLFVHQNCPGQFRHLAAALAREPGNDVVFISQPEKQDLPGVRRIEYTPNREGAKGVHRYLRQTELAYYNGQRVAQVAMDLRNEGFFPDVMIGNPGWGETLFLKDIFPDSHLVSYCEFYYRGSGSDVNFDPEFHGGLNSALAARGRSAQHLLAIEAADSGYSPTQWQKQQFPLPFQNKIEVIHDGIDCSDMKPDPTATIQLKRSGDFTFGDEVLTYVARNLEPYRGFHIFMRALPRLLEKRPNAHVVVLGGDEVSYGGAPGNNQTWRQKMLAETGLNTDRVHFVGRVPRSTYARLLQVSAAHVYLTYPFVLSWSALEAMACGCHVIGSRTPPVEEVLVDGVNGTLTDFFDSDALADKAADALANRHEFGEIRRNARQTILGTYELNDCLQRQRAFLSSVSPH